MSSILQIIVDLLRSHKLLRTALIIVSSTLLTASTWLYFGVSFFPRWWRDHFGLYAETASGSLQIMAGISTTVLAICLLSSSKQSLELGGIEVELAPIRRERKEIRERIEHGPSAANVLSTIELGLNQITEYYTINKSQARKSFSFSVFAVVMGLVTLIGGAWLFYFGKTPNVGLAALSGIGGLLLQFIGGASFYIYNKSLAQLNYFYDKLVRMQDTMLSIQLCDQLEDKARQSALRERLILEILTRQGDSLFGPNLGMDGRKKRNKSKKAGRLAEQQSQATSAEM